MAGGLLSWGERFGSGDGERKTSMTRQMPYEPLPASVLFGIVHRSSIRIVVFTFILHAFVPPNDGPGQSSDRKEKDTDWIERCYRECRFPEINDNHPKNDIPRMLLLHATNEATNEEEIETKIEERNDENHGRGSSRWLEKTWKTVLALVQGIRANEFACGEVVNRNRSSVEVPVDWNRFKICESNEILQIRKNQIVRTLDRAAECFMEFPVLRIQNVVEAAGLEVLKDSKVFEDVPE